MGKNILNKDIVEFPDDVEKYDFELKHPFDTTKAIPIPFQFFIDLFCVVFRIGNKESLEKRKKDIKGKLYLFFEIYFYNVYNYSSNNILNY